MRGWLSWTVPRAVARPVCFALIYVSYMCFYFDRKNYAFWLNELIRAEGKRKEDVSVFGSVMEMAYGSGKLIAGPLVDSQPPSVVLYSTLAAASLCNLLMFRTDNMALNSGLWAANGLVQSAAWPALASIFMNWFEDSPNRGIWYSVLSTNQNLGSALTPVLLTPLVAQFGWRAAVVAPGVLGLAFSCLLFLFLQEQPSAFYDSERSAPVGGKAKSGDAPAEAAQAVAAPKQQDWRATLWEMFTSVNLLSLGVGYAFLTTIRVGVQDWSLILLQETRQVPIEIARDCLVSLEVGGFVGGLSAGAISDRLFAGRRGPALVLFTALIAPVIAGISWLPLPEGHEGAALVALYFMFGFASFGPHMLVGLTAREVFPQAQSTAGAFTKSLAQVGGTLAGYPLSLVVSEYGWGQIGMVWAWCAALGAVSFAPLLAVPAFRAQKEAAAKPKQA